MLVADRRDSFEEEAKLQIAEEDDADSAENESFDKVPEL